MNLVSELAPLHDGGGQSADSSSTRGVDEGAASTSQAIGFSAMVDLTGESDEDEVVAVAEVRRPRVDNNEDDVVIISSPPRQR